MLTKAVEFFVPGQPQGKGRPRAVKIAGHTRLATPQKTVAYEGLVALAGTSAMEGRPMVEGAVSVDMVLTCQIPSMSKVKKSRALSGELRPAKKPDIDNVVKAIFDGMNGIVWKDDSQVVALSVQKIYGEAPGVSVGVYSVEEV